MGYTHYWEGRVNCSAENWNRAIADLEKVIKAAKVPLAGPDGDKKTKPELVKAVEQEGPVRPYLNGGEQAKGVIAFNGVGEDSHESFVVEHGKAIEFDFCKTALKPYDPVVCAALTILKHYCPGLKVSSDGGKEDWRGGINLCQEVLGYGVYPCEEE